jgi:hypothetical protein
MAEWKDLGWEKKRGKRRLVLICSTLISTRGQALEHPVCVLEIIERLE